MGLNNRAETILPSGIILPDLRSPIERMRRFPKDCLYCEEAPVSVEHILPESLGGRLTAKILCAKHNHLVGRRSDEPLVRELHSCVHFLGIRRQRGRGSELRGRTDDGKPLRFSAEGVPQRQQLEVLERSSRKIRRARGSLLHLDSLLAQGALADKNAPVIAYLEKAPPVTVSMAIGADAEKAVLKIALHFIAGFVEDIDRRVALSLLPFILGDDVAGGEYVRTLSLEGRFFPSSWPPKHVVAVYPSASETFVTVLLFGLYGFQVRLPMEVNDSIRYVQNLVDGDVHPILEENDHARTFGWDDRLTEHDLDALRTNLQWRHDYIMDVGLHRTLRSQCRRAAYRASEMMLSGPGLNLLDCFKACLPLEGFSTEQISIIMYYASIALRSGRPLWDLPFEMVR
jgi:hypothetical protein